MRRERIRLSFAYLQSPARRRSEPPRVCRGSILHSRLALPRGVMPLFRTVQRLRRLPWRSPSQQPASPQVRASCSERAGLPPVPGPFVPECGHKHHLHDLASVGVVEDPAAVDVLPSKSTMSARVGVVGASLNSVRHPPRSARSANHRARLGHRRESPTGVCLDLRWAVTWSAPLEPECRPKHPRVG